MDSIYQVNIERAVLSSILFNPHELEDILGILKPRDFYLLAHQNVFEVMIQLHNNELPIDEEFIKKRIDSKLASETDLINILSSNAISNTLAYVLEIKELSRKKQINDLTIQIKKNLNEDIISDDLLSLITKNIEDIENDNFFEEKNTLEILEELKGDMKKANENNEVLGQKSGLIALDNIIGAFEDGDLIIVAARPSMGKTSYISAITNKALEEGNGVLIESLEMPAKKILNRLISSRSGESLSDLKKGHIKNKERFEEACNFFACENLVLHDNSYPTIMQLQSRIKKVLRKKPNIKNVFVDHTGKIQLDGKTREDIEIGHITNMLKKIARDFNIRVFLLQQLNRGVESRDNKRPILSDLKNSGNIEEDADIVLGLYRDSYYKTKEKSMFEKPVENSEIIILKNRDGETRTAKVAFEGRCARFIDRVDDVVEVIEFEGAL